MDKQTVHVHLRTHNIYPQSESRISWKILHSNINYRYEVIEALEIRNYSDRIVLDVISISNLTNWNNHVSNMPYGTINNITTITLLT